MRSAPNRPSSGSRTRAAATAGLLLLVALAGCSADTATSGSATSAGGAGSADRAAASGPAGGRDAGKNFSANSGGASASGRGWC